MKACWDTTITVSWGLPSCWLRWQRISLQCQRPEFNPWVRKIPWSRARQHTPVFLPGESHGQRSLVGYGPWGCKESDMTKQPAHTQFHYQRNMWRCGNEDWVLHICGEEDCVPLLKPNTEPARSQQRMTGSTFNGGTPSGTLCPLVLTLHLAATVPAGFPRGMLLLCHPKISQTPHSFDLLWIYRAIFHSALLCVQAC